MSRMFLLTVISFVFHFNGASQKTELHNSKASSKKKDWTEHLRNFRNALYCDDKKEAARYLRFPFNNGSNDIWYLIYSDEKELEQLPSSPKPLNVEDFHNGFRKIFPQPFVACFLKLKVDILKLKGEYTGPVVKIKNTSYRLYASYNRKDGNLELNLSSVFYPPANDPDSETVESNIIYRFTILQNGAIQLSKILLAG